MSIEKINLKFKKNTLILIFIIVLTLLSSCSYGGDVSGIMNQHNIADITFSDKLFGTEEIGISGEELLRQRPQIGNKFVSNELIDGENLYIYSELCSDSSGFDMVYSYYVYKDVLVGVATDYILRKTSADLTEDELFKTANECIVSFRNAVEERYGLEGTFEGIHYKYDGDMLKSKPTINGMWKNESTEMYIATSLKEYDDVIFTVHLTYGTVTTDKIAQGQETALVGVAAESEIYEEDRFVTFTFAPDGETEVVPKRS